MAIRSFGASRMGRLSRAMLPKSTSPFHTSSLLHQQQHHKKNEPKYYLPHESAPHAATILGFPSRQSVSKALHPGTCREIVDLAATIAEFEPVRLYTRPEDIVSAQELIKQRIRQSASTSTSTSTSTSQNPDLTQDQNNPASYLGSNIHILPCLTNHCWVRDTGPVFVRPADANANANPTPPTQPAQPTQQAQFAIDFSFCEWGNKHLDAEYASDSTAGNHNDDPNAWPVPSATTLAENAGFAARVINSFSSPSSTTATTTVPPTAAAEEVEAKTNLPTRIPSPLRLEGGGIEVDGQGTFLATKSSIFHPERNPNLTTATAERELSRLLGVSKFIWFPGRRGLDVTDAHVDALVRVVRPGVVVVSRPWGYGSSSSSHASSVGAGGGGPSEKLLQTRKEWILVYEEIRSILAHETDALGRRFEVHDIEEPDPGYVTRDGDGDDLDADPAASYVNFYFANGAVVVPVFGDPMADERAVQTMRRLVPEREVRTVRVNCLPRMGGVVHCVTQQVPLV